MSIKCTPINAPLVYNMLGKSKHVVDHEDPRRLKIITQS